MAGRAGTGGRPRLLEHLSERLRGTGHAGAAGGGRRPPPGRAQLHPGRGNGAAPSGHIGRRRRDPEHTVPLALGTAAGPLTGPRRRGLRLRDRQPSRRDSRHRGHAVVVHQRGPGAHPLARGRQLPRSAYQPSPGHARASGSRVPAAGRDPGRLPGEPGAVRSRGAGSKLSPGPADGRQRDGRNRAGRAVRAHPLPVGGEHRPWRDAEPSVGL